MSKHKTNTRTLTFSTSGGNVSCLASGKVAVKICDAEREYSFSDVEVALTEEETVMLTGIFDRVGGGGGE